MSEEQITNTQDTENEEIILSTEDMEQLSAGQEQGGRRSSR